MPPLYFLVLAVDFRIFGPGLVPMRALSLVAGIGVLLLTYAVCRKAGAGRTASAMGVSILALDRVFLRGSLIGRMDMLALVLILATLLLALRLTRDPAGPIRTKSGRGPRPGMRAAAFLTGALGTSAFLVHPFGWVAPASLALALLLAPGRSGLRGLGWVSLGMGVAGAIWGLYILGDPAAFAAQFGSQLARKAGTEAAFLERLRLNAGQYGRAEAVAIALWLLGLVGLADAAWRDRRILALPLAQVLILGTALSSMETWYALYAIPLTMVGWTHLVSRRRRWGPLRAALVLASAALALTFTEMGVASLLRTHRRLSAERRDGTDYRAWSARVGDLLPPGSTVLLATIPDPYLGLSHRRDLRFREFPPFPVAREAYRALLDSADIVVLGRTSIAPEVEEHARARGRWIGDAGDPRGRGYLARVYDVRASGRVRGVTPGEPCPGALSPEALSPGALSPEALSPGALGSRALSPGASTPRPRTPSDR
jgi:hypothetical protein